MSEAQALMAVARAQKALLVLTKQTLKHDASDGLQRAMEAKQHLDFYSKLRDEWVSVGLIGNEEAAWADKVAGLSL